MRSYRSHIRAFCSCDSGWHNYCRNKVITALRTITGYSLMSGPRLALTPRQVFAYWKFYDPSLLQCDAGSDHLYFGLKSKSKLFFYGVDRRETWFVRIISPLNTSGIRKRLWFYRISDTLEETSYKNNPVSFDPYQDMAFVKIMKWDVFRSLFSRWMSSDVSPYRIFADLFIVRSICL